MGKGRANVPGAPANPTETNPTKIPRPATPAHQGRPQASCAASPSVDALGLFDLHHEVTAH